jgi:hypothetical protein
MMSFPFLAGFRRLFDVGRVARAAFCVCALSLAILGVPRAIWAQSLSDASIQPTESAGKEVSGGKPKAANLRQVLIFGGEAEKGGQSPRRLSKDERSALHRDLRDAMRDAYADDAGRGKKP